MFIRFIYAYRWKATGKALYVGSAFNPASRDKAHSKGNHLPFQRFITKHGRKKFTLEIVEAFRAETIGECWKLSAARENHWMDVLKTWHEFGGHNYQRADVTFDTKQQYAAARVAMKAAGKKRSQDPAWRAATTAANRKNAQDPAWRAAHKAAVKNLSQDPAWRAAHVAGIKKRAQDPIWRAAMKSVGKRNSKDPKWRAAITAANRKKAQDPTWLASHVEWGKKRAQDPIWRAAHALRMKKVTQTPAWQAKQAAGAARRSLTHQKLPIKGIIKKYQRGASVYAIARSLGCAPDHGQNRIVDALIRAGVYRGKRKLHAHRTRHTSV